MSVRYEDAFMGVASEIIDAMSALDMKPEPMDAPAEKSLSETDKWAHRAMQHLKRAMELHREAHRISILERRRNPQ